MEREEYLESLRQKLDDENYEKLKAIKSLKAIEFIAESEKICNPDSIFVCSDSPEDVGYVREMAIKTREETPLAMKGHTVHFDGIKDQGRDRKATKYLVPKGEQLPKALNQIDRDEGIAEIMDLLKDSMKGKIMIVRFLTLGPKNSIFSIPCLQCTDSWYVAHSEDLLYRPAYDVFVNQDITGELFRVLHSAGELDERMVSKNPDKRRIYIDYSNNVIYSVNTQYAGNTVGFKKLAFRLTIRKAHAEGWLAEHMLLVGVHGPGGRKTYFTGAFPSACGKTSTAMLPGERIVGDDIAYLRNINGIVKAVNAEAGIFGIIQNVNPKDDPIIYKVLTSPGEVIFSNVLVKDGKPYWLGMGCELPKDGINFSGQWYEGKKDENGNEIPPAHKNARYTVSLKALENVDPELDNPEGVELGGIMFGGRDARAYVPVQQGFDWVHGIIAYGAALETETTFATIGKEGVPEINIMSIQDFVSISLGKYLQNYIEFGRKLKKQPLVFGVNYFLRDENGKFVNEIRDKHIWIKWMELRVHGEADAIGSPTGLIPRYEDLKRLFQEVHRKEYSIDDYIKQFTIRVPENIAKVDRVKKYFRENISDIPPELFEVLDQQKERLLKAREKYGDYISPESLK